MKTFYIKLLPFVSLAEKGSLHKYERATTENQKVGGQRKKKTINQIIASIIVILVRVDIFHIKL